MNHSPTTQEKFWATTFGNEYIERNPHTHRDMDRLYQANFGITRSAMNKSFLPPKKSLRILEIGCNVGAQLAMLKKQGYSNLYGIEINPKAVQLARSALPETNVLIGSAFDLPFRDGYFDLVFTSGVLIHIAPKDLTKAMKEIYRVSNKYIWGFEYFNPQPITIVYRGHNNRLWKRDFADLYLKLFPKTTLIKQTKYQYKTNPNIDTMFLLKK